MGAPLQDLRRMQSDGGEFGPDDEASLRQLAAFGAETLDVFRACLCEAAVSLGGA